MKVKNLFVVLFLAAMCVAANAGDFAKIQNPDGLQLSYRSCGQTQTSSETEIQDFPYNTGCGLQIFCGTWGTWLNEERGFSEGVVMVRKNIRTDCEGNEIEEILATFETP